MLTQELKDIILHEIEIDPMRIGYHTYIDNYRKTGILVIFII